jgi:hypothetical protein
MLGSHVIELPRPAHRQRRKSLWRYVTAADAPTVLAAPLTYSMLVPFALLHAWVELYQAICFRAWRLPRVRRRDYFVIDRHRLAYLNGLEKLNCMFCSYANGVVAYTREVAARTEQYWCPIQHARRARGQHERHRSFATYGDGAGYRTALPALRRRLRKPSNW